MRITRKRGEVFVVGDLPPAVVPMMDMPDGRLMVSCAHPNEAAAFTRPGARACLICGFEGQGGTPLSAFIFYDPG